MLCNELCFPVPKNPPNISYIHSYIYYPYLSIAFLIPKNLVMKRLLLISAMLVCIILISSAQAPKKFNYQAVARDNTGAEIKNQSISVRMSIRSGSTSGVNEYVETFSVTTNEFGLFAVEVGGGTPVLGSMSNIDWGNKSHFLAVEVDFSGGSNYQLMSITQLLSVPYALYAEKSGGANDGDTNSTNEIQVLSKTGNTVYLSKAGGSFIDEVNYDDADSLNELQTISRKGLIVTLSHGGGSYNDSLAVYSAGNGIKISNNVISTSNRFYLGKDTLNGIIFYIYIGGDGQQHGLLVSKTETTAQWQSSTSVTNANRSWDGYFNTSLITSSPAVSWITALGTGWYMPSFDELNLLWNNRFHVNQSLNDASLSLLKTLYVYWSSTEYSSSQALGFYFRDGSGFNYTKTNTYYVRGIKAF